MNSLVFYQFFGDILQGTHVSSDDSSVERELLSKEPSVVQISSSTSDFEFDYETSIEVRTPTNIYVNTPQTPSFDEALADIKSKIVVSLSFMRKAITNGVNPAESNALRDQYREWSNCDFKFLKDLFYGIVLENFSARFSEVMNHILELKKYANKSLASSKILALLAPEPVISQEESMLVAHTEAGISSAQILANQQVVGATYRIPLSE